MPKFRTFEKIYKDLNVKQIQETPTIPESERASNQCEPADHSMCDFIFDDYSDGRGVLIVKGKRIRITNDEFSKFSEFMKGEE